MHIITMYHTSTLRKWFSEFFWSYKLRSFQIIWSDGASTVFIFLLWYWGRFSLRIFIIHCRWYCCEELNKSASLPEKVEERDQIDMRGKLNSGMNWLIIRWSVISSVVIEQFYCHISRRELLNATAFPEAIQLFVETIKRVSSAKNNPTVLIKSVCSRH